jgi:hypothetical protein
MKRNPKNREVRDLEYRDLEDLLTKLTAAYLEFYNEYNRYQKNRSIRSFRASRKWLRKIEKVSRALMVETHEDYVKTRVEKGLSPQLPSTKFVEKREEPNRFWEHSPKYHEWKNSKKKKDQD